jgi:hypothetical protein
LLSLCARAHTLLRRSSSLRVNLTLLILLPTFIERMSSVESFSVAQPDEARDEAPLTPSPELLAFYRQAAHQASSETALFAKRIALVQPNCEERHRLDWEEAAQESELQHARATAASLKEAATAAQRAIAERGVTIAALLTEQKEDRTRVQRLLALCQPVAPDITVLFEHFKTSERAGASSGSRAPRSSSTGGGAAAPAAAAAATLRTRSYEQHLLKRVEVLQAHAVAVEATGRTYLQALSDDSVVRSSEVASAQSEGIAAAEPLRAALAGAQQQLQEATAEYLRLRHNARAAHAVSREEHRQCKASQVKCKLAYQ